MDIQWIYECVSERTQIHLGVADKFLINRRIRERNYKKLEDVYSGAIDVLASMGYESGILNMRMKRKRAHDLAVAEYSLDRYRKSRQPNNL